MKKGFFIFFVLLLSLLGVYWTLKTFEIIRNDNIWKEINNFLQSSNKLFYYDNSKGTFSLNKLETDIYYQSLNPIDGVYYKSDEKKPLTINVNSWKIFLKIKKWEYVFMLNDVFSKYEVIWDDFRVSQLWKWLFYIDSTKEITKIYSFNSMLWIRLFTGKQEATWFDLFPSLLFEYDPKVNKDLLKADIIRVANVDNIMYLDWKEEKIIKRLYPDNLDNNLIKIAYKDIKEKITKFTAYYEALLSMSFEETANYWLIKNNPSLFKNNVKKEIFYSNVVAKNFLEILKNDKARIQQKNKDDANGVTIKQKSTTDTTTVSNIQEISDAINLIESDEKILRECIDIIKNYYYLSFFWNVIKKDQDLAMKWQGNVDMVIKKIFGNKILWWDYYAILSDIYFAYDFSDIEASDLDSLLYVYIKDLSDRKVLKEKDQLSISFFLMLYNYSSNRVSSDSVNIIKYYLEVFNNYYLTISWNNEEEKNKKKYSALSIQFYNLAKIILRLNDNIYRKYFKWVKKIEDWKEVTRPILKDDYVLKTWMNIESNIWSELLDSLNKLYKDGINDLESKKQLYFDLLPTDPGNSISTKNNYTILKEQYDKLGIDSRNGILYILNDYWKYYEELKLNKKERDEDAIIIDKSYKFSKEDLVKYLSWFREVNVNSLIIWNESTMSEDWYYDVKVNVIDKTLSFQLYPTWHTLRNIIINSNWTIDDKNKSQIIVLDEKKKVLEEMASSAENEEARQKYNFANFFVNAFVKWWNMSSTIITPSWNTNQSSNQESREDILFKNEKLVWWDFKNIKNFMPIPFNKIKIQIVNQSRNITLSDIPFNVSWDSSSYLLELNSQYNFSEHRFENMTFRVKTETNDWYRFDWISITLSPENINILDIENEFKDLWKYFDTISSNYKTWNSIKIDLNLKKVSIDSKDYQVKFEQ